MRLIKLFGKHHSLKWKITQPKKTVIQITPSAPSLLTGTWYLGKVSQRWDALPGFLFGSSYILPFLMSHFTFVHPIPCTADCALLSLSEGLLSEILELLLSRCWDSQAQLRTNWERDTGVKQMEMIKQLEECASGLQPSVTAHDGAWILQTCSLGHSQSKVVLTPAGAGCSEHATEQYQTHVFSRREKRADGYDQGIFPTSPIKQLALQK